jgi:hypothetical protein
LGELSILVSFGTKTLFDEGETIQDSPGEFKTRLYQIELEPGESERGYVLPIEALSGFEDFRPAGIYQLLAFNDKHPDFQLEETIWAPGESFVRGGTHSVGLKELIAAKDGLIIPSESIESAYGTLGHWKKPDGTRHRYLGLKHPCWLSHGAALFLKQV